MASGFSLKDQLFNAEKVGYLGGLIAAADPGFSDPGFQQRVMQKLPELELKERITFIAEVLDQMLPADFYTAASVVERALPPPLDPTKSDGDFGDFIFAPLGEMIVKRGLEADPDRTLEVIEELTQRFSMEWAVRPILVRWPKPMLDHMRNWARHDSYHVRRLVSEGTRPRLPWGTAVGLKPHDTLPLLDALHADPTRYVTRSVANHLNDLTRKDPDLAIDRLADWQGQARQSRPELDWMTGHALRGLVKAGHPRAMQMLGFDPAAKLSATISVAPARAQAGDVLEISCQLTAPRTTPVLVDYVIGFAKSGGKTSKKVFKLKQTVVPAHEPLTLSKRHRLKGDATTFRLYPGRHSVELQVNGRIVAATSFDLTSA